MVHGPTCRKRVMVTEGQVLSSKSQARAGLSSAACRRSRAGAVLSRSPPPHPAPTNQVKMHSEEDFKVLWKNVGMSPFLLISQTVKHAPRGLGERK